jgi:hypothetical protein
MDCLDIGMVGRIGQDARNDATLVGHLETAFNAEDFEFGFAIRHVGIPYTGRRSRYSWGHVHT